MIKSSLFPQHFFPFICKSIKINSTLTITSGVGTACGWPQQETASDWEGLSGNERVGWKCQLCDLQVSDGSLVKLPLWRQPPESEWMGTWWSLPLWQPYKWVNYQLCDLWKMSEWEDGAVWGGSGVGDFSTLTYINQDRERERGGYKLNYTHNTNR